jgi:hypothetical protein
MTEFAASTGLWPAAASPRRYLWTDAFAVCNFLELWRGTGDEAFKDLAVKLVDQVHHTLGRHRQDDPRKGWISGLDENKAKEHPTAGGLRIGKELNERKPSDPIDERKEWIQDGQYFHYLTKWMHALYCMGDATGDAVYSRWAVELAKAAYRGFVHTTPSGSRYMHWKMSIDLSYPLVFSMGHHDPLDGLITFSQLQVAEKKYGPEAGDAGGSLTGEIAGVATMCKKRDWATDDSLGLGGLLCDAYRIAQLRVAGDAGLMGLLADLPDAALVGLKSFVKQKVLRQRADYRLAFRELGLSIGLHALVKLKTLTEERKGLFEELDLGPRTDALMQYLPVGEMIETFWLEDIHRQSSTWQEHCDINSVMLATSLMPDRFLTI